ncbi:H(+)/Cl(-) exchange transporter ClcA [Martelella mediterranea]|uniref:CIC family chloride channel protein n=1 Tax=Martelella mediterranea TaxID=293089 RepID=A0A4R3P200_9HYPH|nr:H(+)/Cl(-) exchange transporter ClcA [Martelella mediterranea]TCT44568.1 CIC family chloride channel protein [Martelella mediterranea]
MEDPTALVDRPGNRYAQARYIFLAALAGVLTGTIGSFFHLFIDHLLLWPEQLSKVVKGPLLVISAALITCAITVVSVFFVKRYAPEAGGSGVQEIEGAMQGLRQVRWKRILPVKFLTGVGALSSGLVLGREGPTIHIGASIAEATTDFFRVSDVERRGMLGAGAAAGLACAFNAPLAAILFIVEETHKQFPYTFRTYMGVIVAALLSTVMTEVIGGKAPDFAMSVATPDLILLPAFVVLGCVLGLIGVILNAGLMRTTAVAAELHKKVPYLFPAIIGLAVGALFILMPLSVTGGEHIINIVGHNPPALTMLLVLAFLRYFTMVGSYSAGTPGGIFAPMLALAICTGLLFGSALEAALPQAGLVPLAFGIAAMGGLFSASVRAPVVGVALTLELTGAYTMTMPLIATCLTANVVAQWLGGNPIYEQLLERTLKQAGLTPRSDQKTPEHSGLA